ncbi:hypothetical protein [Methylobacterium pseudosasicola]|uniref:Uncharacterized protein n=1 Tax=Methylobacterium pseudosasicola TaxID=582667 RepID=A0A1I4U1I4_9HYPH|nr:hypothetical protein [Methylobacterium pseudosasicola]SFM82767.1 hypothetical protein SAMN05192568_106135 [Methylobacterium pseudosasicola]
MTRILDLPLLKFAMVIANNEDWTDAWTYVDEADAPISLAGITLTMMLRTIADDPTVQIVAASVSGLVNGLPQNGSVVSGGDGLNVVALSIPKVSVGKLSAGEYVFEVQASGDGQTRNIATGPVTVNQGVVR